MATISDYNVVIAGASFGGCAAALAAAANPRAKVVLLEPSDWVGGQATSQGCTRWDETAAELTESTGSPKSYRDLRHEIRARYPSGAGGVRSALGQQQEHFNPGFAAVGPPFTTMSNPPFFAGDQRRGHPFAADPKLARDVLKDLLQQAGVTVTYGATVTAADVHDGAVHGLTVQSPSGTDSYVAAVYVDATDLGDLFPLCFGNNWVIGAEAGTGEAKGESVARPDWIQPFTVPIALEWGDTDGEDLIGKPDNYEDIRKRQVFDRLRAEGDGDIKRVHLHQEEDTLWNYRQFIDPFNFVGNPPGRTTINVGSNDYLTRAIPTRPHSPQDDATIVEEARAVSTAYLYYLQNDVPRDDNNGTGYKNIKRDTSAFDTPDGTAPAPYIRESRRLANPLVRIVQSDIDAAAHGGGALNRPPLGLGSIGQRGQNFRDSCGIGQYGVDVHQGWYAASRSHGPPYAPGIEADAATPNIGTRDFNFGTVPFQVPLGALLPKELNNFVAACKNIGATHVTSGAYRVHPVEWAIGEGAGVLAGYCVAQNVAPGAVWGDAGRVMAYQRRLLARGTPIFWWDDVAFENNADAFAAIQLLGAHGVFEGDGQTRNFDPQGPFSQSARDTIDQRLNHQFNWDGVQTRGEAAVRICTELEQNNLPLPLDPRSSNR
jgi:hypothetical protein